MAMADYVLCSGCGRKAIYDGDLDWAERWQGGCGHVAALCWICKGTHVLQVVERPLGGFSGREIAPPPPDAGNR